MLTTTVKTNVREVPRIPRPGEVYISANLGKVNDPKVLWNAAESVGFEPELVAIQFPDRIEIHLLLHYEQCEPGTLLGGEFDTQLDALVAAGIPDEGIRFVYGGSRAIAA
jgi:hypothetical protein